MSIRTLHTEEKQGVSIALVEVTDPTEGAVRSWEVTCELCDDQESGLTFPEAIDVRYQHLDGCAGGDIA